MAYPYGSRGLQSPRDEQQMPSWPNQNPLSPQRNPNRYSGSMLSNPSVARGSLSRRYTTNELPTLTPIGQQRKQAAGDYMVSASWRFSSIAAAAGGEKKTIEVRGWRPGGASAVPSAW